LIFFFFLIKKDDEIDVCLSAEATKVSFAVRAVMVNVHAFVNAARNQTAAKPTSVT
jgi:hypothetical protein